MTRPIVIVDPLDSGTALAPAFAAAGIPAIAIRSLPPEKWDEPGFGGSIHAADFQAILDVGPGLVDTLRGLDPCAIIPGAESGVTLADELAAALTPALANVPALAPARRHKGRMQAALAAAGLPVIRTLETASQDEAAAWIADQGLARAGLVVKPALSAGSDNVHHVLPGGDWRAPFEAILASRTKLRGEANATVIVQELVVGTEFAVDTVSADGEHVLAHLIRYAKTSVNGRMTVFDHTEFVAFEPERHGELLAYVRRALDALGIRWGAAHSEVMLTPDGPRLIETGARTCGGPVLGFSRVATGSSQLERVVEVYGEGRIRTRGYDVRQTVVPVFLIAPEAGVLRNVEALEPVRELSTFLSLYALYRDGDAVLQTVDYDTILGVVALAGEREAVFADYARVRAIEAGVRIEPVAPAVGP